MSSDSENDNPQSKSFVCAPPSEKKEKGKEKEKEGGRKTRERLNPRKFNYQQNAGNGAATALGWTDLDGGAAQEGEHIRKVNIFEKVRKNNYRKTIQRIAYHVIIMKKLIIL